MIAVMVLVKYKRSSLLWGVLRLMFGRIFLWRTPGLQFVKVLGSGKNGGFGVKPGLDHQGLFCLFDTWANAQHFLNDSQFVQGYRRHAQELLCATLSPFSSRGSWAGQSLAPDPTALTPSGPVAALTRASIRPQKAWAFWTKAPPAEDSLQSVTGCLLSAGLGEAPFFRQATFSIWESTQAMDDYARQGAHLAAIHAAYANGYFSESMFVRFKPITVQGSWQGHPFNYSAEPRLA